MLAARTAYRADARRAQRAARIASLVSLGAAIAAAILLAMAGPSTSPLAGLGGFGMAFRLDPLSVFLFLLVTFIGHLIFEYSRNYLAGNDRQAEFFRAPRADDRRRRLHDQCR